MLMRDYGLDLQARWQFAAESLSDLTLDFLAFAEGRFLTIHPFQDFNGRTIRVFLLELLRRLDLPRVGLAPQTSSGRTEYFAALEAADHNERVVTGKPDGELSQGKLSTRQAFAAFRDAGEQFLADCIDAISAPQYFEGGNNPLWLNKVTAGRAHVIRTHRENVSKLEKLRTQKSLAAFLSLVTSSLEGQLPTTKPQKGKGAPFFSDAIKSYNVGSGWIEEKFPFNPHDYILAVEGAFAMRGAVARTLGANTRRFAAFPFCF